MSDRELLELAAKAIGGEFHSGHLYLLGQPEEWNPLNDDGDALRMAVRANIVPRSINGVCFAWADGVCDVIETHGSDQYAATRRAIVRAAAEIGRQA